ncbi:serine protease easter-like [Leguminivora glycinivorella]|uniref:serine protease easter-like n=1 Tax=Leguminivora glycinivorella TaxID=1035111 RepID=UPI00200EBA12|nr:serine protease easter-like [Leguminivora glycinivorella]
MILRLMCFVCVVGFSAALITKEICIKCVPIKECPVFGNLTKAEQKRWTSDFSCRLPNLDTSGLTPNARDYICCPHTNAVNFANRRPESHASQISTKHPRSTDNYDSTPNPDEYERQRQPENVWMTQETNDNGKEYDSQRMLFWQQGFDSIFNRPNRPLQSMFGSNPFQNPYFMGKPRTQPNQRGPRGRTGGFGPGSGGFGQGSGGFGQGSGGFGQGSGGFGQNSGGFGQNSGGFGQSSGGSRQNSGGFGQGSGGNGQCSLTSFPPEPNKGCCGRDVSDADRIIGGKTTEIDQFPWTVLLNSKFTNGRTTAEFSCGGSLISARYVLTAAHCLYDETSRLSDVEVYLAEYDKRTFPRDCMISPGEGRRCIENIAMRAEDVVLHPQYDDTRLQNDIALIRLKGTAPYTDYIRPICLPLINVDSPDFSNLPLSVAGWGRNGRYQSDVKQSTVVHLVPQGECKAHYPHLTRRHVCAAGHTGEDTCKGDSGGPLMMLYRGKHFVAGIVSGKRADSPCGSTVPSLYTNVFNYLDWIKANIRN